MLGVPIVSILVVSSLILTIVLEGIITLIHHAAPISVWHPILLASIIIVSVVVFIGITKMMTEISWIIVLISVITTILVSSIDSHVFPLISSISPMW